MRAFPRDVALLPALGALASACAFNDVPLTLPTKGLEQTLTGGRGREVVVVVPFADAREGDKRCGMQKNGYNMDTADAVCQSDPTVWIAQLLERNVSVEASRVGPEPIIRGRAVLGCVMLMLSLSLLMGMVPGSRPMHLPTALATMGCACVALAIIATSFRDSKRARIERQKQLEEELGPPLQRAA